MTLPPVRAPKNTSMPGTVMPCRRAPNVEEDEEDNQPQTTGRFQPVPGPYADAPAPC